jgi:hypothetical protein
MKKLGLFFLLMTLAATLLLSSRAIAQDDPDVTAEPGEESTAESTESDSEETDELFLLENVPVANGGIEVFPLPDRASGRLFAAVSSNFAPHVVGRFVDEREREWFYIYYADRGRWMAGWVPARGLDFSDIDKEELEQLPEIDPEDLPELPEDEVFEELGLEVDSAASRPYGTNSSAPQPTTAAPPTEVPAGNPPPPPPPPPNTTPEPGGG